MSADVRCGVCGKSGASRHYGGVSCLSCRAHFRRVVRQNLRPLCAKGGGCEIVANGRKCCRACRYSRCLAVGMDPKLVQSDRTWDKDARPRWKTIEEKRAEKSSSCGELVPSSSRHLGVLLGFEGPLGFRPGVQPPARGDFSAFLRYALKSDRFVDEFADTGFTHNASPPHFRYDMNLSIEEAFFSAPRRLANRTKMVWQPNSWVTGEEFQRVFCRGMLYCIDVISTIPELRLLEPRDQMRLMVGRGIQTGQLTVLQKTLKSTQKRCILVTGGSYLPLEEDELTRYKPERALADYVEIGLEYYDNVVETFKAARLSDEEFLFLRMLVFFSSVPGLSPKGRQFVRETHDYYQSLFIRFFLSSHDRQTALHRMAELLSLLPLIEQAASTAINYTSKAILFNYAEFQGNLMFELHKALSSRPAIT